MTNWKPAIDSPFGLMCATLGVDYTVVHVTSLGFWYVDDLEQAVADVPARVKVVVATPPALVTLDPTATAGDVVVLAEQRLVRRVPLANFEAQPGEDAVAAFARKWAHTRAAARVQLQEVREVLLKVCAPRREPPRPEASVPPTSPREVLGVGPEATPAEIKAARNRFLGFYPDRHQHLPLWARARCDEISKIVNVAYEQLQGRRRA
jgi:hypothetical protein